MRDELTILYVEDEEDIRHELVEILELDYSKILVASDGEEGLQLYKEHHPDLVITDVQMPKMDGLTMCRHIRQMNQSVPIILTTAFNEEEYKEEANNRCQAAFITKPISVDELYAAISSSLEHSAKTKS